MIKYFGLIMILASAFIISREYEKNQKKRLFLLSEFIRFCEHIRLKISCFLAPKTDWLSDFQTDSAELLSFLSLARQAPLDTSFREVENVLFVDEKRELTRLFSSIGKGYRDGELALLDDVIEKLRAIYGGALSEIDKNVKTVRVLVSAISLGIAILLI